LEGKNVRIKTMFGAGKKNKPRSFLERGSPVDQKPFYLRPLLEALSGLIFDLPWADTEVR